MLFFLARSAELYVSGEILSCLSSSVHMQGPAVLPACITVDRTEDLTGNQVISNRFVLYERLTELALRAVRAYVASEDAASVAQAISELMIKQAETTDSLVEVIARKLPILHHVGIEWPYMAVRPSLAACFSM